MSVLSPTLLDELHCQPGLISRVSLLPVVYVLVSLLDPGIKSLENVAAEKPAGSDATGVGGVASVPAVKREAQSGRVAF